MKTDQTDPSDFERWRRDNTTTSVAKDLEGELEMARALLAKACMGTSDPRVARAHAVHLTVETMLKGFTGDDK